MKFENSNRVFILNKHGKPLMPCKPCKARLLLKFNETEQSCARRFFVRKEIYVKRWAGEHAKQRSPVTALEDLETNEKSENFLFKNLIL